MRVYLVRHTAPLIESSYCYGQTDVALHQRFMQEYKQLQPYLPLKADAIYTSPLKRCNLLATEIQKVNMAPLFNDDRLKEMNFGSWELKKWDDIDQKELNSWMNDFVNAKVPLGESFMEISNRVSDFIKDIIPLSTAYNDIIVITHAGVIRCFLNFILDLPLKNTFKLKIDFGSVTLIEINEDPALDKLVFFNKN